MLDALLQATVVVFWIVLFLAIEELVRPLFWGFPVEENGEPALSILDLELPPLSPDAKLEWEVPVEENGEPALSILDLKLPPLSPESSIEELTVPQLRALVRSRGLKPGSRRRAELISLLS